MANYKGIDVSQWQGNIDFNAVKKAGYTFVIIRAGYGKDISQKDPYFESNYKKAKAAGLNVGAYWYSYATNTATAKLEAQACMQAIKGKTFEYPIYFDLEEQAAFKQGKVVCSAMVETFCDALEKAGYFSGLYISRSPLQSYITSSVANRYALWVAEYSSKCNYGGAYGIWQYSSSGRVSGISGNVDLDTSYVDYPTVIKNGGYNGFEKPKTTPATKTLDTAGFKYGDKSSGVLALKQLLIIASAKKIVTISVNNDGGFGGGTQNAVNALLKAWGYKQNGIAGDNFIKKLGEKLK